MKKHLGLIMSIVAIVFCVLNIISFFVPVTKLDNEDTNVVISSMELAFTSKEGAQKKVEEYSKKAAESSIEMDKDAAEKYTELVAKYTYIAAIKADETANTRAVVGAYMHFVSMLLSIAAIVFIVLNLCGKNFTLIANILLIASIAFALAGLISYICLFNTKIGGVKISESFNIHAGIIMSIISTILACCATVVPCLFGKKKSN